MWRLLKVFLILPPLLLSLDYVWLGVFASKLYKTELGGFLRMSGGAMQPIVWAAVLVYLAIAAGIVLLVLPRVTQGSLVSSALLWGAVYGILVYAIYDMTNYSLVQGWPLKVALIDICWGGVLNALGSLAAALLDRWFR